MKHLVLFAHPNPQSLSKAMADEVVAAYQAEGHEVVLRDLYALGFDPILKGSDFVANEAGNLPEDIKTEQGHVTWAEAITVIYPVWWTGMPAILKGYVDRIFLYGFAYAYGANGPEGLLKGKKVLILNTMGNPNEVYEATGMLAAMRQTSDVGIFGFSGMDVVDHRFFGGVPMADEATRKGILAEVGAIARRVFGAVAV